MSGLEPLELERHLYQLLRHVLQLCTIEEAVATFGDRRWVKAVLGVVIPPTAPQWDSGAEELNNNAFAADHPDDPHPTHPHLHAHTLCLPLCLRQ